MIEESLKIEMEKELEVSTKDKSACAENPLEKYMKLVRGARETVDEVRAPWAGAWGSGWRGGRGGRGLLRSIRKPWGAVCLLDWSQKGEARENPKFRWSLESETYNTPDKIPSLLLG